MIYATAFRIIRAKIKTPQPGEGNSGGAHRAGLQGDVQIGTLESFQTQALGGGADYQQFGMRRGITARLDLIVRPPQHLTTAPVHKHGTDRHLA